MSRVFISHSESGIRLAEELARALEARNVRTWLDKRDISAGEDWRAAVKSAIESADRFLFVVTPEETVSPWVRREWQMALKHYWDDPEGRRLIPVLVGGADPPPFLQDLQAVRVEEEPGQWSAAVDSVVSLLESPTAVRDESGYAKAQAQQRKHLDHLEEWARRLKAAEGEASPATPHKDGR